MRAGFLGIGFMGQGMGRNILRKQPPGARLTIYDVLPAATLRAALLDAVIPPFPHKLNAHATDSASISASALDIAPNVAYVVRASDVIALSLPSQEVHEKVLFGPGGVVDTFCAITSIPTPTPSSTAESVSLHQKQQKKTPEIRSLTILDHGTFSHAHTLHTHARLLQVA